MSILMYVCPQANTLDVMLVPVSVTSHDQKNDVAPHFNHLDLMNAVVSLVMLLTLCDANAGTNHLYLTHTTVPSVSNDSNASIKCNTWPRSHFELHFNYLGQTEAVVPFDDAFGITWCWWWSQWHHMTKNPLLSHFDHLDLANATVLLMILLASCDPDNSMNAITWLKCYITHCVNCLDLINTVLLLTMPLALCDAAVSANSVKWLQNSYWTSFQSFVLTIAMVPLVMPSVSYDAKTSIGWPESHVEPHFSHLKLLNKVAPLIMPSV